MNGISIARFSVGDLAAWSTYWNLAFAGARNAWTVTADDLRRRVIERATAVETFDPAGLLLARVGEDVVGMIHVGRFPEVVCRTLDPAWPGGERGYVALGHVLPGSRRQGVGAALWRAALLALEGCREIIIDSRGINPWYGNSMFPETPFFGTPEGIALPAAATETLGFLKARGFDSTAQVVTMVWEPTAVPFTARDADGWLFVAEQVVPEIGSPLTAATRAPDSTRCLAVGALDGETVAGFAVVYELAELKRKQWGIWLFQMGDTWQGRGWGRALLARMLAELRSRGAMRCEAVTDPERSAGAFALYQKAGFKAEAPWALFG